MFLELAIGAAIVGVAAYWWAWYSASELVLARFVRDLGYPEFTLDDFQTTQGRLDLVRDELSDRYQEWCRDAINFAFDLLPNGAARDRVYAQVSDLMAREPDVDALEAFYDNLFFDLQYRSLADDVSGDRYTSLDDRLELLVAQLRLLKKLEGSFPEVRAT